MAHTLGCRKWLTTHSTGPARKAAQAGEFRRWAAELLVTISTRGFPVSELSARGFVTAEPSMPSPRLQFGSGVGMVASRSWPRQPQLSRHRLNGCLGFAPEGARMAEGYRLLTSRRSVNGHGNLERPVCPGAAPEGAAIAAFQRSAPHVPLVALPNPLPPNPSVNRTPRKLRLRVPSALRAPVAGYVRRWASRQYEKGAV